MAQLACLIESVFLAFGCWTLAYHISLLLGLPARLVWLPFLAVTIPVLLIGISTTRRRAGAGGKSRPWFLAATVALSLTNGLFTLVAFKPDLEDFSYFHRALTQSSQMDRPFVTTYTGIDVTGLSHLSGLHTLTSYEPLMAVAGWWLCGDPLWFFQNIGAFLAAVLFPAVLVTWFRHLGLRPAESLAATIAAMIFLLFDGKQIFPDGTMIRSFGSISLLRWQGKCVLWTIVLPAGMLFSYRFLRDPSTYRFLLVFMSGVSAVGLSNSGTILYPALVFGVSGAYVLTYGPSTRRLIRALIVNGGSVYCLSLGIAFAAGMLGRTDMSVWEDTFPLRWRSNVNLVIGGYHALTRDVLLLSLVPFLVLPRRKSRFLIFYTLTVVATVLNPLTGRWIMKIVTPASYRRFVYLLPVPLCAGLVVRCFVPGTMRFRASVRLVGGVLTLATAALAYRTSALADVQFKPVWAYKLPTSETILARKSARRLGHGAVVLAPHEPAWVMSLLDPSLRLVSVRTAEIPHVFRNANRVEEGAQRVEAQKLVTEGEATPERMEAFLQILRQGLDAIVVTTRAFPTLARVLDENNLHWRVAERTDEYRLILLEHPTIVDQSNPHSDTQPSLVPRGDSTLFPASRSRPLR